MGTRNFGRPVRRTEYMENDLEKMEGAVEAVLFAAGGAVPLQKLADALETDIKTVKELAGRLEKRYEAPSSGIRLARLENSIQLCTKPECYNTLSKVVKKQKKFQLTDTVMETLSIIAYRQPVTKTEIEKIRGVSSDHAVNKLVELGMVKEQGRLDAPGRPILFVTTEEFLRVFGISSPKMLPAPTELQMELFREEAEEEVQEESGPSEVEV